MSELQGTGARAPGPFLALPCLGAQGSTRILAVEFDVAQDYPVSLERLWTALGRADYVEQKYRRLGSR